MGAEGVTPELPNTAKREKTIYYAVLDIISG